MSSQSKHEQRVRTVLYVLITLMVFEGLIRKVVPSSVGLLVFFGKDLICLYLLWLIFGKSYAVGESVLRMTGAWKFLLIGMIPQFLMTLFLDPILLLWGMKQYTSYIVLAIVIPIAFPKGSEEKFKYFLMYLALLLIPTSLTAMLQNSLPSTHWLNMGIGGTSLEGFAAGGYLRVSSTFSFTGQYSWFLNVSSGILAASILLPSKKNALLTSSLMRTTLICLFVISIFITGGRTAVFGSLASLFIGLVFNTVRFPARFFGRAVFFVVVALLSFSLMRAVFPQFFAAYEVRSAGSEDVSHSDEIGDRLEGNLTSWTEWLFEKEPIHLLFGSGLGVMSNGVDRISSYAYNIRKTGFWTESDMASAAWEGGLYFVVLWYSFRLWIIYFCYRMWKQIRDTNYSMASAFILGYIVVTGCFGTITTQAPLAIWFWMSVGCMMAIYNLSQKKPNAMLNSVQLKDETYA